MRNPKWTPAGCRSRRKPLRLALGLALFILSLQVVAAYGQAPVARIRAGQVVPGRHIVVLHSEASQADVVREHGLGPLHRYQVFNAVTVPVSSEQVKRLAADPRVRYTVPDVTVSVAAPPPGKGKSGPKSPPSGPPEQTPTGVLRIDADQSGVDASQTKVAIIDTGIDKDHPDLRVAGGVNFTPGPARKYGDGHGHGTHVAGIVGAKVNGVGVVGVAPGAQLYAVRVLDETGSGFLSDVIAGVDWAAAHGMDVANLSLSAQWLYADDPLCDAISAAAAAGVVVVVAAGNMGDYTDIYTPAHCVDAITVSAIVDTDGAHGALGPGTDYGADDAFASFSNFGQYVDIAAPGVDIYSTWRNGAYAIASGTSMASPHVAGAVALYLAGGISDVASVLDASGFPQVEEEPGGKGFSEDPDRYLCDFWISLGYPDWAAMSCGAYEPLVNASP